MRLLYVADGRSPTAQNWMRHFTESGHDVHLLTTYACEPGIGFASVQEIPVAFSQASGARRSAEPKTEKARSWRRAGLLPLRSWLRHWLGPWTVVLAAERARDYIEHVKPDLVHAMRIPFEGMLASSARPSRPLLLSVWGNDFTLHAGASPGMRLFTRRALQRADALHADCRRDLGLAKTWGLPDEALRVVLPGGGGVRRDRFHPGRPRLQDLRPSVAEVVSALPASADVVVNPRGFRDYVRNDTFFQAIPEILRRRADTRFLCPAMANVRTAESWVRQLGIADSVHLLPWLTSAEMAVIYQLSQIVVSPSEHDGTPNTFLEALACGCFPVVGDIASLREWVDDGENGFLVDPGDPGALADVILRALQDHGLRERARDVNLREIKLRADYPHVMAQAESFYERVLD